MKVFILPSCNFMNGNILLNLRDFFFLKRMLNKRDKGVVVKLVN